MARNLNHYPPNPAYGSGTFRRRIVLTREGTRLSATLLDDFHTMDLALTVVEGVVVDVAGNMERFPKTTCPGAVAALQAALRGKTVGGESALIHGVDRGGQCTHLIDLAMLALSWSGQDGAMQLIEVALTDRDGEGRQDLLITVDGAPALSLELQDETIKSPAAHSGRKLFGGFARWVDETFPPEQARLWLIAQISLFVAGGRAHIVDGPKPRRSGAEPTRRGACFSYTDPAFAVAIDNVGYVCDMTAGLPAHPGLGARPERNRP